MELSGRLYLEAAKRAAAGAASLLDENQDPLSPCPVGEGDSDGGDGSGDDDGGGDQDRRSAPVHAAAVQERAVAALLDRLAALDGAG